MKRVVFIFIALIFVFSCSSKVKKTKIWKTYPGCNEAQCQSWYEECSSECLMRGNMGVTECENKCYPLKKKCVQETCALK